MSNLTNCIRVIVVLCFIGFNACSPEHEPKLKLSLAQWSLHRSLQAGELTTLDFPGFAKNKFGIKAVEYVNQFFADKAEDVGFLTQLKENCEEHGVQSLLIMVDGEGELSAENDSIRRVAINNHFKWVDAAAFLGCHSIRVNLHGSKNEETWKSASVKSLKILAKYGKEKNIVILVENHGQWSSKGSLVAEIIHEVNSPWCGTLPDLGNFCVRRRDGDMWESPCVDYYDAYKGVDEMMPYAKGVSAKTREFNELGQETTIDYKRMMRIIHSHKYTGFIGIEYEGTHPDEVEGIRKTIALLQQSVDELQFSN